MLIQLICYYRIQRLETTNRFDTRYWQLLLAIRFLLTFYSKKYIILKQLVC